MNFSRCAVAMAILAVAVGSVVVHGVLAQNPELTLEPLDPKLPLASPQVIEQRSIRYESSIDANGQPQTRGVWEIVPVSVSQPADSETAELAAAEVQAAKEAQNWLQKLQTEESEGKKAELKSELRAALLHQFEAQQKQRTREIASIEERLNQLKETLQKRDAAKDKIVDRRLDQLTGVRDELAWEETPGVQPPGNNRFPNNLAYPPGLSPQPMGVPFGGPRAGNAFPPSPIPMTAAPGGSFPAPPPTAPTLTTPVPAAPPVPPAPPTRLIPSRVPSTTTPAPPPAPAAPAAAPALPALPEAAAPTTTPRVPPTPARTP